MRKTIILFLVLLLSVLCVYADESNSSLNGNGYLQLKTYSFASKNSLNILNALFSLEINRSELAVSWEPNSVVNSLISIGNDEMVLTNSTTLNIKDVKIDFKPSSLFVLSIGIHKLPFSYELLESDTDLDFINRSESVLAFAPYRMPGIQIAGEIGFFEYVFRVSDTSSRNYVYTNRYIYDDSDDKYANARVIFNFTSWLHFAISEFYNIPISTNLSYMFKYPYSYMVASAGELTLDFYPLVFKGEYLHGYPNNYVYSRSNLSDYSEGWYAQFGYTLLDKYVLLLKWDHLWSSDYYAGNYRNTLTGMPMLKNKYLLGLNYYYNKNLKLQFNWEYNPVDSDERHKFIFQLQTDFDLKI